MSHQQLLRMHTKDPDWRSECDGWSFEDSACAAMEIRRRETMAVPVGLFACWDAQSGPKTYYKTVLHAMADGWKLIAPPVKLENEALPYQWWLTR